MAEYLGQCQNILLTTQSADINGGRPTLSTEQPMAEINTMTHAYCHVNVKLVTWEADQSVCESTKLVVWIPLIIRKRHRWYTFTFLPPCGQMPACSGYLLVAALRPILLAHHFLGSLYPFVPVVFAGRLVLFGGFVPAVALGFAALVQVNI